MQKQATRYIVVRWRTWRLAKTNRPWTKICLKIHCDTIWNTLVSFLSYNQLSTINIPKVPLPFQRAKHGWSLRTDLHQVCQSNQNLRSKLTERCIRPRSIPESLVNAISNDSLARSQIQKAIQNPKLLMISDWFHNTSEELRDIALSANIDTL